MADMYRLTEKAAIPRKGPVMEHGNPMSDGPFNSKDSQNQEQDQERTPRQGYKQSEQSIERATDNEVENADEGENENENENENGDIKRPSRVAALRSKFSPKSIRVDRDQSKVDDNEPDTYEENNVLDEYTDDDDDVPHNSTSVSFNEEKLYTPVPKKPDIYPQSAPASSLSSQSESLDLAGVSASQQLVPTGDDNEEIEWIRRVMDRGRKRMKQDVTEDANEQVNALQDVPTRGHADGIKTQSNTQSLKTEKNESIELKPHPPVNPQPHNTTTHGGFAPPPPDPTYQNTITLEQQLYTHTQALHHHITSAVARLTKTFEASHNWAMDQILRNVEAMADTARVMNSRSVCQSGNTMGLQQEVVEMREQVQALRMEVRRGEERLGSVLGRDIERLRGDLMSSSGLDMAATKPKKGKQDGLRQGNKREENQHAKNDTISTPTVPDKIKPKFTNSTPGARKSSVRKNPAQESSGSPEPRAAKLSLDAVSEKSQSFEKKTSNEPAASSSRNEEGNKTPYKKGGMFNFRRRRDDSQSSSSTSRFLRTPRRNRDNKAASANLEKTTPAATATATTTTAAAAAAVAHPSTPPVPPVPANLTNPAVPAPTTSQGQGDGNLSPSAIHPLLRNPHQQQIMREREQHLHQQTVSHQMTAGNYHAKQGPGFPGSSTTALAHQHQHNLRTSRSHQGFVGQYARPPFTAVPPAVSVPMPMPGPGRYISAPGSFVAGSGLNGRSQGQSQGHGGPGLGPGALVSPPQGYQEPVSPGPGYGRGRGCGHGWYRRRTSSGSNQF